MKTVRSVILVTTSASMLVAGWVAGGGFAHSGGAGLPVASGTGGTTTPTGSATGVSGTFDGAAVDTRYGSYQAEITVAAGKITDVTMLQSGASDGTSRQISGYALPQLISAVLEKQTFSVGYVSGASYTTQGFESSVQSAMQAAGLA